MTKRIYLAACVAILSSVGNYAMAQTTTTTPTTPAAPEACRPTDPCYDIVPTGSIIGNQRFDGVNGVNALLNSTIDLRVGHAADSVTAAASTIGNNFKAEGRGAQSVSVEQVFQGDAFATLNARINSAAGDVDLAATAIDNNASLDMVRAGHIDLNQQILMPSVAPAPRPPAFVGWAGGDPTAIINADLGTVGGNLTVAATAAGNMGNVKADMGSINARQVGTGVLVRAAPTVNVGNVAGKIDVAATALGNSLTIRGF